MNDKAFQIVVVILLMAIATHQSVDTVVWHALFIGGMIALFLLAMSVVCTITGAGVFESIWRFVRMNWGIFVFFGGIAAWVTWNVVFPQWAVKL